MTKVLLLCLVFLAVFVSQSEGRRRRDPPPPPPPPNVPLPPSGGLNNKPVVSKNYPKKWNWKKLPGAAGADTFFYKKTTPALVAPTFFDSLFEAKEVPKTDKDKAPEQPPLPTIMDGKRSMQVAIIMKKLKLDKDHAVQEVTAIVNDFKVTDPDRFRQLLNFIPNKDEIKAVGEMKSEATRYSEGDQVIITLAKMDHLPEKMNAARTMSVFTEESKSLADSIARLTNGLRVVEKSTKLEAIIKAAWAIGAVINKGGNSFPLSALLSLDGAKDSKTGMTYLHYLVAILQKQSPDALKLSEEAALVDKPLGPSKSAVLETLDAFSGDFEKLKSLADIPVVKKFYGDHVTEVKGLRTSFEEAVALFTKVYKYYILDEKEGSDDLGSILHKFTANLKATLATMVSGAKPGVIDLDHGTLEFLEKAKTGGGKKEDPKKDPKKDLKSDPKKDPKKPSFLGNLHRKK